MGDTTGALIVGAGAGALAAAESLRARGYAEPVLLIGEEIHHPYDRPPLSKQVLTAEWPEERALLRTEEQLEQQGIRFRLGTRATGLDAEHTLLELSTGERLGYRHLIIATGVRPRRLGCEDLPGVFNLHTLDDVRALREQLHEPRRVAVVGAGVLGSEIAASLAVQGHSVLLLARGPRILEKSFGPEISERIAAAHAEAGVEILLHADVAGVSKAPTAGLVMTLSDRRSLAVDIVIVAIGSTPNTEWLEGSTLRLDDGVLCDAQGRAADRVFAVGDVARWFFPERGAHLRVEHRLHAAAQAEVVAAAIVDDASESVAPAYFWSDHYAHKIQAYGEVSAGDETVPLYVDAENERQVIGYVRDGILKGAVAWNAPREIHKYRSRIGAQIE